MLCTTFHHNHTSQKMGCQGGSVFQKIQMTRMPRSIWTDLWAQRIPRLRLFLSSNLLILCLQNPFTGFILFLSTKISCWIYCPPCVARQKPHTLHFPLRLALMSYLFCLPQSHHNLWEKKLERLRVFLTTLQSGIHLKDPS